MDPDAQWSQPQCLARQLPATMHRENEKQLNHTAHVDLRK